jgi:hypothetical protein
MALELDVSGQKLAALLAREVGRQACSPRTVGLALSRAKPRRKRSGVSG